jgi:hypothetical protein
MPLFPPLFKTAFSITHSTSVNSRLLFRAFTSCHSYRQLNTGFLFTTPCCLRSSIELCPSRKSAMAAPSMSSISNPPTLPPFLRQSKAGRYMAKVHCNSMMELTARLCRPPRQIRRSRMATTQSPALRHPASEPLRPLQPILSPAS